MKEKTILQWFEQAKAEGLEWADLAIKYVTKRGRKAQAVSMRDALERGFVWGGTKESHYYWQRIAESLDK